MRRMLLFIPALLILAIASMILSQSSVKNPHGELKWDCQDCHTTESWSTIRKDLKFDHAETGFQLTGAHQAAQCIGCHKDPVFSHVSISCADCHSDHHNGQLGTDCQNCHTPRDWQNRRETLELHSSRGFALTGAHAVADCEACHSGHNQQQYAGAAVECYACHAEAYASADNPPHAEAGFPLDCETCHQASSASWQHADFAHSADFPLTGGHRGVACQECHASGYAETSADCYSCHAPDFASTADPSHEASGFTHDCTLCHTVAGWQPASYDHAATSFPLTGAHRQVLCVACHATQYAGTPTACIACHQTDYDQTTEPNHQLAQFDHNCTTCHTTTAWDPSSFDHTSTDFALTGQHASIVCSQCHATTFAGTPSTCYDCHQTDFESVSDPNHVSQAFSHDCTTCHSTSGWSPSTFNHANTAFPLTGKHLTVTCTDCHTSGYTGTPTDCYSCHQTDFESVGDPNHVQANFSHTCTECHTTNGWTPANFNHAGTAFPLTGAHIAAACIACHSTQYAGTSTSCLACHESDYQGTANPSHSAAGFPPTCETCHSTAAWTPANWDHDTQYFPITSGAHQGIDCNRCHLNQASFATFECIDCHQHDKTSTDNHHSQVNNYQYLSTACYECHPRGRH